MLLKLGVDISRLEDPMRRALNQVEAVFKANGEEAIVTSTYEGNHMPSSLHYRNRAADFRLPPPPKSAKIAGELRLSLGPRFDVVVERDHFHVEYDPK